MTFRIYNYMSRLLPLCFYRLCCFPQLKCRHTCIAEVWWFDASAKKTRFRVHANPPPPPITKQTNQVLAAAVHAASEAGALMKAKVGADVLKTKFNPKDLLTEVDGQCQTVIEKVVSKQFPEHALLGEENVAPGAAASTVALSDALDGDGVAEWLWIVDPIDGTTNFVHGIPLSAVSIGVAYRGQVVVGKNYVCRRKRLCSSRQCCSAGGGGLVS